MRSCRNHPEKSSAMICVILFAGGRSCVWRWWWGSLLSKLCRGPRDKCWAQQRNPRRDAKHIASVPNIDTHKSEAWGPSQFWEKKKSSLSEKAIVGALGEFRGILGAALGIRNSIIGIRNSILGMAFHDLSNMKTISLGATPGAIPGIDGKPICPCILGALFQELGWSPRARIRLCLCQQRAGWINLWLCLSVSSKQD